MDVTRRIALLVQAQGARRAGAELDTVAGKTKKIGDESKATGRKMDQAKAGAERFHGQLRGVATAAKVGAVGLAALAVGIGKGAVDEYREAERTGKATNAVLTSTGGAAHVSAKRVSDLSTSLSMKAGVDDELIQKGANLLLTFRSIRDEAGKGNDIFDRTTKSAVDMSAAFTAAGKNMSVADASLQLGKALNDPAKGMTRLQRVGVSFTQSQIDQAKALEKHGNVLGAQKIILGELTKEFGGAAAATADPVDKANVAWKNLEETIGTAVIPSLSSAITAVAKFANEISTGTGAGGKFRDIVLNIGRVVIGAVKQVISLVNAFRAGHAPAVALGTVMGALLAGFVAFRVLTAVVNGFRALRIAVLATNAAMIANPAVLVVAALVAIGVALFIAYKKVGWFRRGVQGTWSWIKDHWPLLLSILTGPIGASVIFIVRHFGQIKRAARDAINFIIRGWNSLHFKIPGFKVGPVHFGGTDIGVPKIPLLAHGGVVRGAGSWVTGERGPELNTSDGAGQVTVRPLADKHAPVSLLGALGGAVLELHSHLHQDGRETAHTVRRVALQDLLAHSPAS